MYCLGGRDSLNILILFRSLVESIKVTHVHCLSCWTFLHTVEVQYNIFMNLMSTNGQRMYLLCHQLCCCVHCIAHCVSIAIEVLGLSLDSVLLCRLGHTSLRSLAAEAGLQLRDVGTRCLAPWIRNFGSFRIVFAFVGLVFGFGENMSLRPLLGTEQRRCQAHRCAEVELPDGAVTCFFMPHSLVKTQVKPESLWPSSIILYWSCIHPHSFEELHRNSTRIRAYHEAGLGCHYRRAHAGGSDYHSAGASSEIC